jgi:hypothetical protein
MTTIKSQSDPYGCDLARASRTDGVGQRSEAITCISDHTGTSAMFCMMCPVRMAVYVDVAVIVKPGGCPVVQAGFLQLRSYVVAISFLRMKVCSGCITFLFELVRVAWIPTTSRLVLDLWDLNHNVA